MEIALLAENSLRVKGKHAFFLVDPPHNARVSRGEQEKSAYNAVIALTEPSGKLYIHPDTIVIDGPGEYEIGGVKMSADRTEEDLVYNLNIDGVEVLLGKLSSLDKMQHKLKEQHIVVVYVDSMTNASFTTSLASNVVIFYGDRAKELVQSFGKANIATLPKYSVTHDKLPQEVETVILENEK
jgi:hypothetical protein